MDGLTADAFVGGTMPSVPVYAPKAADAVASDDKRAQWSYEEAFKRNRGLITEEEQQRLRNSRVAIAGMGGVGGLHLITLARLGIGKFTIADPDEFEVANFNRQYGATISNLGRNKAEAMAEAALDINPELEIRVIPRKIDESNVTDFLGDADIFVDGLDFFVIDARRLIFRRAAEHGIYAITSGPIGFSAAWLVFDPNGMSFDRYFAISDKMPRIEKLVSFAVGLTPKGTHLDYMDLSKITPSKGTTPCCTLACSLSASIAADRITKILLGKPTVSAPYYEQFDPYSSRYVRRRLHFGNYHPLQRLKKTLLVRRFSTADIPPND